MLPGGPSDVSFAESERCSGKCVLVVCSAVSVRAPGLLDWEVPPKFTPLVDDMQHTRYDTMTQQNHMANEQPVPCACVMERP